MPEGPPDAQKLVPVGPVRLPLNAWSHGHHQRASGGCTFEEVHLDLEGGIYLFTRSLSLYDQFKRIGEHKKTKEVRSLVSYFAPDHCTSNRLRCHKTKLFLLMPSLGREGSGQTQKGPQGETQGTRGGTQGEPRKTQGGSIAAGVASTSKGLPVTTL